MSQLVDLLTKPFKDMTVEELEKSISLMKKLRHVPLDVATPKAARKSNKERQLEDLINQLSPEQMSMLINKLKEEAVNG
jgi:hypothetical protein